MDTYWIEARNKNIEKARFMLNDMKKRHCNVLQFKAERLNIIHSYIQNIRSCNEIINIIN